MTLPKVSIIIPCYNYGHLINQTLICLQNQSYTDWEAIIVDDGSTDNTKEVVHKFAEADKRFLYIHQKNNGVSSARNNGLKQVSGELIQFLDADDMISKDKIYLQVKYLQDHPEVALVNVNTRYFQTNRPDVWYTDLSLSNTSEREEVKGRGPEAVIELVEHNPIVIQGPLFKITILNQVPSFIESMKYLEDWDYWIRIALSNYRFDHLDHPEAISLVRVHPVSASQNGTKIQEGEGFFRNRLTGLIQNTLSLTESQKETAMSLNIRELRNTYKYLMARTGITEINRYKNFYNQLQNPKMFFSCFIKSLNLKRKLNK